MARPRTRIETTDHATDPTITLIRYRRGPSSKVYEAQITLRDGSKKIVSTSETDPIKAQFAAIRLKEKLSGQIERTGSAALRAPARSRPTGPTFEQAARLVIEEVTLQRQTTAHELRHLPPELLAKKLSKFRQHIARIESFLIPALGTMTYGEITSDVVEKMVKSLSVRRQDAYGVLFAVSARQSTIGNLAHTYTMVADKLRRISNATADFPRVSRKGMPPAVSRDAFDDDEMRRIIEAISDEWVTGTRRANHRAIRRLLRAYVHICATTGIRPGLEMERLTFGLSTFRKIADPDSKQVATGIMIRKNAGKHSAERVAIVYANDPYASFDYAMRELTAFHGGKPPPGTLLFQMPESLVEIRRNHRTDVVSRRTIPDFNSTFRDLLATLGLRFVPGSSEPRSLYSLRHYYANRQIRAKAPIYNLARRMGTSVKMIELYYGAAIGEQDAALAAGFHSDWREINANRMSRERAQQVVEAIPAAPLEADAEDEDDIIRFASQ
jgi:hypothetical protein